MKKVICLLLILLLSTGCTSLVSLNGESLDSILDTMYNQENTVTNVAMEGYRYYLPKGLQRIASNQYNSILFDQKNYYYLYVDAVSYYHKVENIYEVNPNAYFSKRLSYHGNEGYVEITPRGDGYFIEAMYQYAKMESLVKEEDIENSLIYIASVLTSIEFNDHVLDTLIGDNILNYQEESLDIFVPAREESEFLEYVEEYGTYQDLNGELPDPDQIPMEEEIK